ncbi:MAG: cytochrome c biogenesis protein ResB, partial [Merismopedia sp. SIO2A8]|nr:cytochrome c biogenesis protein ResB [Merismopedia sp. SIO2A8]
VRTDSGPNHEIRIEGDVLEVVSPDQNRQQTDIFIQSDGSVYPRQFAGLTLTDYSDDTIQTVNFSPDGPVENLAIKLQFTSDRMGQTFDRWLAVAPTSYSVVDMGPAQLELVQATTNDEVQELLREPNVDLGIAGTLQLGDRTIDVAQTLNQPIQLANGIIATITHVWPDFRLDENHQPTSSSDQFRNPALQLNIAQGEQPQAWFIFARPGFDPIRSGDRISSEENALAESIGELEKALEQGAIYTAPQPTTNYFRVVSTPEHQLLYAAKSSKGFQSGVLTEETSIRPGWADMRIALVKQLDHAQLQRQTVPVAPVASGTMESSGTPALHVSDSSGVSSWLQWGTPTTVETPNGSIFAAFSPKLLTLPFYVKLDDFIVERNEGSESVAMWTSQVTLFDPETDTAVQRSVWMNHPTWFRGWKLAQASWNPGDLQQSTLQLKREPWWVTALTWLGSLMVVCGIMVMFYGRAIARQLKKNVIPISRTTEDSTTSFSEGV